MIEGPTIKKVLHACFPKIEKKFNQHLICFYLCTNFVWYGIGLDPIFY